MGLWQSATEYIVVGLIDKNTMDHLRHWLLCKHEFCLHRISNLLKLVPERFTAFGVIIGVLLRTQLVYADWFSGSLADRRACQKYFM
jgi:hypothetical protein